MLICWDVVMSAILAALLLQQRLIAENFLLEKPVLLGAVIVCCAQTLITRWVNNSRHVYCELISRVQLYSNMHLFLVQKRRIKTCVYLLKPATKQLSKMSKLDV